MRLKLQLCLANSAEGFCNLISKLSWYFCLIFFFCFFFSFFVFLNFLIESFWSLLCDLSWKLHIWGQFELAYLKLSYLGVYLNLYRLFYVRVSQSFLKLKSGSLFVDVFVFLCYLRFDWTVPMQYLSCVWFTKLIDYLV